MISSRQRKYALVTGASSGIGREYAAQLAAKGYDLVMAGNRDEENRAAAREIAARYGVRTLPLCMDLSEPDAAVKLHAETSARGIEIGVLVCNAGVLLFGPLAAAHKGVGDDEQQNGGETPKHRIQIFKPRKSSKLFDMISSRQRKYALVTGASSGIGREYAAQLAAKGYDLVMAGNRDEENRAAAREIAARYGVRTLPLCMDLSEPDAAVKLHAETSARGIEIGVLVCNAGVLLFGPLAAAPPERIGRIVTLHCTTPALLCRLYGEEMRRRGEGYILVMSSATAWMPYPTIAAYAATKSFLRTFARSLNFEFRKYGVRVTGVFPGAVDTPLYDLDAACRRRLLRWGVMSAPQEVAQHGLRALFRGRSSCIPGVFTKICVCVCRLVPAWLMRCVLRIPAVARLF